MNNLIAELKEYAKANHVPIILDDGLAFLVDIIKKNNIKKVLEIGTAIGYSAINMVLAGAEVTTIERDLGMYNEAKNNIKKAKMEEKINIIFGDALEVQSEINDTYDLLFIDAAKGQYRKFFDIYVNFLNPHGIIICDNMDFHGLADSDMSGLSKNLRQMLKKLNDFKEYLFSLQEYDTKIYHIGDGLTLSLKKY